MHELRLAARRLRADPGAAGGAILAAALGAGLNTAVFAIAYGVLARPLPYANPSRLVVITADASLARVEDWRRRLPSFEAITAYGRENFTVQGAGDPRLVPVALVDDRFFATLGSRPSVGRTFGAAETTAAVVSERFATQSGIPAARLPGTQLTVGDASVTICGVMPTSFAFPSDRIDVWIHGSLARAIAFDRNPDARRFRLVGRLKPGVTIAQASDDATRARREIDAPNRRGDDGPVKVQRLEDVLVGSVRTVLLAFSAAGVIVLLIACANVASILVGRTLSRQREIAVRRALGASPRQLLVTVVAESLLIALSGAFLGVAIAAAAVRGFQRWAAGILPRLGDISIDWVVLLFAIGVAGAAALLAAMPAFTALGSGAQNLRINQVGARRTDRRVRGALVAVQIALAVVLLAAGALLARTIVGLLRADIGVSTRGAAVTQVLLTQGANFNAASRGPLLREILRRVRALPGVVAAGAGSTLPPDNASIEMTVTWNRDGVERTHRLALAGVTSGYLRALGARFLQGRDFEDADDVRDRPVVVLSQSAVPVFVANGDPIGRELPMPLPGGLRTRPRATIVGVVGDIKYSGLQTDAGPAVYVMWRDLPAGQTHLALRTSQDPIRYAATVRDIFRSVDRAMPVMPFRSLDDVVQRSVSDRRLNAMLGAMIALLAFAVAMVGLGASLMRVVWERRQELAIRAALGASPGRAVRGILLEGAALAGTGVALGCAGALAVGRTLASLLHGVSPHDPWTLTAVASVVMAASLVACYVPARRAAKVDPLALLRSE